jgi:hypothetical protein
LSSDESDQEYQEVKQWDDDLIKDDADRAYLNTLTEMQRESILAERAEKVEIANLHLQFQLL